MTKAVPSNLATDSIHLGHPGVVVRCINMRLSHRFGIMAATSMVLSSARKSCCRCDMGIFFKYGLCYINAWALGRLRP